MSKVAGFPRRACLVSSRTRFAVSIFSRQSGSMPGGGGSAGGKVGHLSRHRGGSRNVARVARCADIALQVVTIALLIALAVVVVLAVAFRFAGASLVWYDEVASVMLAWITYYGAALAALRRRSR